jgi:hypothetical protein
MLGARYANREVTKMITNRAVFLGLALSCSALAAQSTRSSRGRFPFGSYDSDAYTLTFDSTGTFRYMKGTQLMVQGKYVVHDSTMALTDERGIDACVGAGRNPGTYRWQLVRGALWFRKVHDPCPDRVRGIADQAWRPHGAH